MKDWEKNIFLTLKKLLVYVKDILIAGLATSIVVWVVAFTIITVYSETIMKTQDWLVTCGVIYIISTLILAIIIPFGEWEENYKEE